MSAMRQVSGDMLQEMNKAGLVCCATVQISHCRHDKKASKVIQKYYVYIDNNIKRVVSGDLIKQECPLRKLNILM